MIKADLAAAARPNSLRVGEMEIDGALSNEVVV
jgi:hypothetical protein